MTVTTTPGAGRHTILDASTIADCHLATKDCLPSASAFKMTSKYARWKRRCVSISWRISGHSARVSSERRQLQHQRHSDKHRGQNQEDLRAYTAAVLRLQLLSKNKTNKKQQTQPDKMIPVPSPPSPPPPPTSLH